MKKHLMSVIAVGCAISILMSGCGVKTDNEAATDNKTSSASASTENTAAKKDPYTDDIKIGFICNDIGASIGAAWSDGMKNELAAFPNVQFQGFDGEASADTEVSIMDNLINQGYDAIILQCTDSAALASSVEKAEAAGIPVVTLNLDADTTHSSLVTAVDYEGGRAVAEAMAEKMGGKGNVVIISATPGATKGENMTRGFKDAMKNYPNIQILDDQSGEWLTEKAYTVMNDFLTKYSDIDGVFCHNDAMAEGAAEAAKAVGRLDGLQIWGLDGESKMMEYIEEGLCTGTVYTNAQEQGATCARMAMFHIGQGVIKNNSTPVVKMAPVIVTSDNVSTITDDMRW